MASQVSQNSSFLRLPNVLILKIISTLGSPFPFATCKVLNTLKIETYAFAYKYYNEQHFIRPLVDKFVRLKCDDPIIKVYGVVQEMILKSQLAPLAEDLLFFEMHHAGRIMEDASLLSFFKLFQKQFQFTAPFIQEDSSFFNHHLKQLDSSSRRQIALHNSAFKVSTWLQQRRAELPMIQKIEFGTQVKVKSEMCILPGEIQLFSGLRTLQLKNLNLKSVCSEMGSLLCLEELDLTENALTELPMAMMFNRNLRRVVLDKNDFTHFPIILCRLRLEYLGISNNRIDNFPEEIICTNLQSIDFSYNCFTAFPSPLEWMHGLQVIRARNNRMGALPDSIDGLKELEILEVTGNPFESLPSNALHSLSQWRLWYLGISPKHLSLLLPDVRAYLRTMGIIQMPLQRTFAMEDLNALQAG